MAASPFKIALYIFGVWYCQASDVYTPGASGEDVVHEVIQMIHRSHIFKEDHQFLKRVAWVESKFGEDQGTYREGYHGGIWQVDQVAFEETQAPDRHGSLHKKFREIKDKWDIDWQNASWEDLRQPFMSGLCARLYLSIISAPIPRHMHKQATYWKNHYNTPSGDGTEEKFISDVEALEAKKKSTG